MVVVYIQNLQEPKFVELAKIIKPKVIFFNDSKLGGGYQNFFFPYGNITVYHSSKRPLNGFKEQLKDEKTKFIEVECDEIDKIEKNIEEE